MPPSMIILGAGPNQLPLIARAVVRGIETHVVAPSELRHVRMLPREVNLHNIDLRNVKECIRVAKRLKPDAILSVGADVALEPWSQIAKIFNLYGPSLKAARLSNDKIQCKYELALSAIPTAQLLSSELHVDGIHTFDVFPCFIKVSSSSGSRGVYRVNNPSELHERLAQIKSNNPASLIFLEECLTGIEYGAQAWIRDGQLCALFMHDDQLRSSADGISVPIGHSMPSALPETAFRATELIAQQCAFAFELQNGVLNLDMMLTSNGPKVIEVGARIGATGIPDMLNAHFGVDIYEILLDEAMGIRNNLPASTSLNCKPTASRLLISDYPSKVKIPEIRIEKPTTLQLMQLDFEDGDIVPEFETGNHRIGLIVTVGNSAHVAIETAEEVAASIQETMLIKLNEVTP